MKKSLRLKLLTSFMAVIIVLIASISVGVAFLVQDRTQAAREQVLREKGTELAAAMAGLYAQQGNFSGLDDYLADADAYLGVRVWIVDAQRQIVNSSGMGMGFGRRMQMGMGCGQGQMGNGGGSGSGGAGMMQHGRKNAGAGSMSGNTNGAGSNMNGSINGAGSNMNGSTNGAGGKGRSAGSEAGAAPSAGSGATKQSGSVAASSESPTTAGNTAGSGMTMFGMGGHWQAQQQAGGDQHHAEGAPSPGQTPQDQTQMQKVVPVLENILAPVFKSGQIGVQAFSNPYYGEKMLGVAVPIKLEDASVPGAVLLLEPLSGLDSFLTSLYGSIALAGLVAIVAALLVVGWFTKKLIRPLVSMQKTAAAMAQGNYKTLVQVEGEDEVGRLGQALNSLAGDLERYLAQLEQMEKLRRDFTANVSHELRTPLTIIRGYDEALLAGALADPETGREYCLLIQEETLRLQRLISDLLDLSRLQGQKVSLEEEKLPLAEVAASVVVKLKQQAEQKQLRLVCEQSEPAPFIMGNGDRIVQLILILVDNALKYTPAGGKVTVRIALEGKQALLEVADTGQGIPEADLPFIWERFYKVDKSHNRDTGGTGLGLALARQIIDLHQGQVKVESTVGQGTCFSLRFPAC